MTQTGRAATSRQRYEHGIEEAERSAAIDPVEARVAMGETVEGIWREARVHADQPDEEWW